MKDRITSKRLKKYHDLTSNALKIAKESVIIGKEIEAKEIIGMAFNYLKDAEYFEKKKDFVNAFAAINYAHGWLDSGVRLDIFKTKNNKLFTVK